MREKGVPDEDARRLLEGLPATFDSWIQRISARRATSVKLGEENRSIQL
jgi:hypothetical protein